MSAKETRKQKIRPFIRSGGKVENFNMFIIKGEVEPKWKYTS
jgi:hypothetical protein